MINEYIKQLSLNDKKSITQKTLKLAEELGELSKIILPFEGAYATNHRIVDTQKILEELVDIHLVNQSIMYSMGFTESEFNDMLIRKSQKWNQLQVKEDFSLSKSELMPYEIHITVNTEDGIDIQKYKEDCVEIGVKPIVLALQDQTATKVMDDVMTSSKLVGNNGEAFNEMMRISKALSNKGYKVIRNKIEASYWHTKAPFREAGDITMPEGCYFECHFNVECTDKKLVELTLIAKDTQCHLSQNAFKINADDTFTIMMTYRSYTQMFEDFNEHLDIIKHYLNTSGFPLEKEIIEFSIYDTRITHDAKWLEA
jgi:NTP pyrophosphatase (non-canonical NTP hydrolase)